MGSVQWLGLHVLCYTRVWICLQEKLACEYSFKINDSYRNIHVFCCLERIIFIESNECNLAIMKLCFNIDNGIHSLKSRTITKISPSVVILSVRIKQYVRFYMLCFVNVPPSQLVPWFPVVQWHLYPPHVFSQVPPLWQIPGVVIHSLMSGKKTKGNFRVHYLWKQIVHFSLLDRYSPFVQNYIDIHLPHNETLCKTGYNDKEKIPLCSYKYHCWDIQILSIHWNL
jgi:hypothetical protein